MRCDGRQGMEPCEACAHNVKQARVGFENRRSVKRSNEPARLVLLRDLNTSFPGLERFVLMPGRWEREAARFFPINPENVASVDLTLDVVDAPLPFSAAVLKHDCDCCDTKTRMIHLGAPFLALLHEMASYFDGSWRSASDLADLIASLYCREPEYGTCLAVRKTPEQRDIAASAAAWLVTHEVGHFASRRYEVEIDLQAPEAARLALEEELRADYCSFLMLMHRRTASCPTNPRSLYPLFAGAGLLVRILHLIMHPQDAAPALGCYGPRIGFATPSPTLRSKMIDDLRRCYNNLHGLADFTEYHQNVFRDDHDRLHELREELHVRSVWKSGR